MGSLPLVSIITPCFNPNQELVRTIKSVQAQSYKHYEHLIIDDCSSQPLGIELQELIDTDPRIRLIQRHWNAGPAVTRNRGIDEAQGEFIAFLDADDAWYSSKLEVQVNFMLKHGCALSYTYYDVVNTGGDVVGTRIAKSQLSYNEILKSNQIGCLTAMYNVNVCGKQYMPNIIKRQDMGLWLKIIKKFGPAYGIKQTLASYTAGGNSVSSNKLQVLKYQWRIYREVEKISVIKSAYYFIYYAWNGVFRKV